ncbi:ATP-grasp domain-containing protein [Alkalibacterium sp. 20]|uniref:ATP-grasp domain-containing protein n=1 Tax=Alkalibacterium sp. 20 TaxID=1798803 RepID=UPI0008FFF11C|nr:ATP-grasp domain-containing protein [Alkalibacterium sp. 20]OJF91901.1 hypothetical protein AX762_10475 [Alkalibacterium sp. 20]
MKILVTGAGEVLGQAAIKSIRSSSLNATIVALNASSSGAGLYWADQYYIVPRAKDPIYMDKIREIIENERPDIILIGTAHEYSVFSDARNEIEREYNTKVLVSSRKVIDIADDKWLTHKFLKDNNLDYPESCLPGDEQALIDKVGFPLIVKPRVGSGSVGVTKVDSISELNEALKKISNLIIQECVGTEDEEYTAGVVVFNGTAKSSIAMKRELRHGNTSIARAEPYSEVNSYLEKIAEKLGVYGPVNLQYRLVGNKVKLFEINARFSGTTHFRTLSNVNEVEMCVKYLVQQIDISQPEIKPVQILRYYDETVVPDDKSESILSHKQ